MHTQTWQYVSHMADGSDGKMVHVVDSEHFAKNDVGIVAPVKMDGNCYSPSN